MTYSDQCTIDLELLSKGKICIAIPGGETLLFDEQSKPIFSNDRGETVVEYTGLSSDGNTERSFAKATYQADGSSQLHYHDEHAENYYIIEGQARVTLNGIVYDLRTGENIIIPAGEHHQVHNTTEQNGQLVLIVKCTPSWTSKDFHLVDEPSYVPHF